MGMTVTSLGRTGVQDWLLQRLTALLLLAYLVLFLGLLFNHRPMDYGTWRTLMQSPLMRYSTLLAMVAICIHAWVGLWTISTDYVKPLALRLIFQLLVMACLLGELAWSLRILWSP